MNEPFSNKSIITTIVVTAIIGLGGVAVMMGSWQWNTLVVRVDTIQDRQSIGYQRLIKNDTEIATLKESLTRIEKKLDDALSSSVTKRSAP